MTSCRYTGSTSCPATVFGMVQKRVRRLLCEAPLGRSGKKCPTPFRTMPGFSLRPQSRSERTLLRMFVSATHGTDLRHFSDAVKLGSSARTRILGAKQTLDRGESMECTEEKMCSNFARASAARCGAYTGCSTLADCSNCSIMRCKSVLVRIPKG